MSEEPKSGVNPLLLGGGFAALIVIAAMFFLPSPQAVQETPVAVATDAPAPEAPVSETADPPAETAAPQEAANVVEDTPEETVAEPPEPTPALAPPMFDTFRVDPDGSIVIAGRSAPGETVDVILAGAAIDRVVADDSGAFVSLAVAAPSDQPRRLSLVADPEGAAVESLTSYIVAPIATPAPLVVAEAPEVAAPAASAPASDDPAADDEGASAAPATAEAAAPEEDAAPATAALEENAQSDVADAPAFETAPAAPPTVLQTDGDGVRIVQGEQAQATANVALDAITYDPQGEVQLSGRASTDDSAVQVYINNEPLGVAPVTDGGWQLDLPEIDTGVYTLRVDEVDQDGTVVSRLETPFKREEPADVAAVLAEETAREGFDVAVRTVQPGSTLWAIAEDELGAGILYVEVFEANRDLIRDPDLIYPGQIFRIPEVTE